MATDTECAEQTVEMGIQGSQPEFLLLSLIYAFSTTFRTKGFTDNYTLTPGVSISLLAK